MGSQMDNLDLLSDDELRHRLVQYGFQNLPVTGTTRKLLIKKLRNHMESEKSKLRRETSYATRYSSGEESDGGDRRSASRRTTSGSSARTSMPPPPARTAAAKRISTNSAISQQQHSSSLLMNNNNNINNNNNNHNKSISPTSGRSSVYISPVIINDSEEEDYSSGLRASGRSFGDSKPSPSALFRRATTSSYSTASRSPLASAPVSSYRSTLNNAPIITGNTTPSDGSRTPLNDSSNSNGSASDSPFISEYTKRLLQLRGETVSHENFNSAIGSAINRPGAVATPGSSNLNLNHAGAPIVGNHFRNRYTNSYSNRYSSTSVDGAGNLSANDIVTHAQPPGGLSNDGYQPAQPAQIPLRMALRNLISKLDEHYGFKQTFIPCALLCLFIAFLVFVAFMYLTISTDIASTLSSIDTRYDLCEGSPPADPNRCVVQSDLEPALELLKLVGTELKSRVEHSKCVDSAVPYWMSADEVLKLAKEHNPAQLIPQLSRHLHAMEYLIDRNPQWKIHHCDQDGRELVDFGEVLQRRPTRSNYFAILKPKLPFSCMIYNKFHTFFVIVGVLGLIGITTYLVNYFFKFVLYVKQKRRNQVNALIGEIIQAVSQAAAVGNGSESSDDGGLVIVNHLRDRLITPDNRKKLEWAWLEALQFLEQNESRIQFEVRNRGGEDFKMMRWIDSNQSFPSSAGRSLPGGVKKWQSPAFDNTNKIPDPPTPCLKIRQMFDKYEVNDPNLKTIVQDAILEKVGARCKIYDIQLERNSCCVYVRCASSKDAGIVHDEINGWWFDNRLVSIKFLRLERYLTRFPRSSAGPTFLKPSNRNNSSMSQQQQLAAERPSVNPLEQDDAEEEEEEEEDLELEQEQEC